MFFFTTERSLADNSQCGVVYRPELSRSEFASAKVLFGSKAAADKAMKAEVRCPLFI